MIVEIEVIQVGMTYTNCYLVYLDNNKGIVVDPGDESGKILKLIRNNNIEIEKILLTHGHFDHIGSVNILKEETGAELLIHKDDALLLTDPVKNLSGIMGVEVKVCPADAFLNENNQITVDGKELFKVIHSPGHTPGGILLYNDKEGILFSGDSIFNNAIGRTDFPGADNKVLIKTINDKILALPDNVKVYPGHGAATTIGKFRQYFNSMYN